MEHHFFFSLIITAMTSLQDFLLLVL